MNCYCDSSFFLRQLLSSPLRTAAVQVAAQIEKEFSFVPLTLLTRFEVIQALRFEAWRNRNDRTKSVPRAQLDIALNLFAAEVGSAFQIVPLVWENVFLRAELLTRSTPENGWRTLDVIHVASAISLGAKRFFSYDRNQNALANREGLETPLQAVAKS